MSEAAPDDEEIIVSMPRCVLCGSYDVRRCPVCDKFHCGDCTMYVGINRCKHKLYEKPTYAGWPK